MAEHGGQPGNQNAAKGRRWMAAVNRALERRSKAKGIEELDRLADEFLNEVEAEGINGFRELADRLDGKPAQSVAIGGDPDGVPLQTVVNVNFPK